MSSVDQRGRPSWVRYAGLGFELAAAVAGFAAFGYWIGGYFGDAALGLVIGAGLGAFGGMYNLVRLSLKAAAGGTGRRPKSNSSDTS